MKKSVCLIPRKDLEKFKQEMALIRNKTEEREAPDHPEKVRVIVTREHEGYCLCCGRDY